MRARRPIGRSPDATSGLPSAANSGASWASCVDSAIARFSFRLNCHPPKRTTSEEAPERLSEPGDVIDFGGRGLRLRMKRRSYTRAGGGMPGEGDPGRVRSSVSVSVSASVSASASVSVSAGVSASASASVRRVTRAISTRSAACRRLDCRRPFRWQRPTLWRSQPGRPVNEEPRGPWPSGRRPAWL